MSEIGSQKEIADIKTPQDTDEFKRIKPEDETSFQEAQDFWDNLFDNMENGRVMPEVAEDDNREKNLEKILGEYFDDLIKNSDYPETISDKPFEAADLEKLTPEQNAEMREEFYDKKGELKREWEQKNGIPWPKYEEDVYSSNGNLIRKAGSDYDAHHIQPLGMGGKNEADNITPLHAEVHYDKQGVHAPDSPYSKLDQMLGGMD